MRELGNVSLVRQAQAQTELRARRGRRRDGAALVGVISSAQATPESEDAEALGNALESFADRLASADRRARRVRGPRRQPAAHRPRARRPRGARPQQPAEDVLPVGHARRPSRTWPPSRGASRRATTTYGGIDIPVRRRRAPRRPGRRDRRRRPRSRSRSTPTRTVNQPLDFAFGPTSTWRAAASASTSSSTRRSRSTSTRPRSRRRHRARDGASRSRRRRSTSARTRPARSASSPRASASPTSTLDRRPGHDRHDGDGDAARLRGRRLPGPRLDRRDHRDEWTSHALTELATASIVDGDPGNDLDATFYVDASLDRRRRVRRRRGRPTRRSTSPTTTSRSAASTRRRRRRSARSTTGTTSSAGDVANGLAQFVASLAGSQGEGNGAAAVPEEEPHARRSTP